MQETNPPSRPPLFVFDPSITRTSPSGSCLLKMLESVSGKWPVHIVANASDLPPTPLLTQTRIPLPRTPDVARRLLFPILATAAHLRQCRAPGIRIATESAFPFPQISQNHFCHRYFLRHHGDAVATTWARRITRTLTHRWLAFLEPIAFRHSRKIVVSSKGTARELESIYPELTRGKICLIPHPVNTKYFRRDPGFDAHTFRHQLGITSPTLVLSFCALGGFTRKGLPFVLDGLAEIRNPGIHLIVIGGQPSEIREFKIKAQRLGVESGVHFVGLQSDFRPYLWSSDVSILPSAYESLPLVCLQAAAAGLPLISTRINGVEDFLIDGVNGWMVDRTTTSVASAIRAAAADPAHCREMGQAAQESAQSYDTAKFQARWLELLRNEFGLSVL